MSHFAQVINGIVEQVIVAEQDFIDTLSDKENWIQTSYNTRGGIHYLPNSNTANPDQSGALRKNYAGIGYSYDATNDAFIPPQQYASWTLDKFSFNWDPPIPYPNDGKVYVWNESNLSWEEFVPTTNDAQTLAENALKNGS